MTRLSKRFLKRIAQVNEVYQDWPTVASLLGLDDLVLPWQMEYYERLALVAVLQNLRPDVAIEVGTHSGGSLAVLSRFSRRVFSLDVNPSSSEYLAGRFPNVEFIVGDSKRELPPILEDLEQTQTGITFVLIDGDHSRAGVLADLDNVLSFVPRFPTVIMAHDSFNPACRAGMLEARWAGNPHVRLVEMDFQIGSIFEGTNPPGEMWGGLAFALLLPEKRQGSLTVSRRHELLFQRLAQRSAHQETSIGHQAARVARRLRARLGILRQRQPRATARGSGAASTRSADTGVHDPSPAQPTS